MKYTNKFNLPDRVVKVIQGKYVNKKPESNRMSVTDLIKEPLIRTLYIEKWDDLVVDVSDFIQATQGNSLHSRYEMMADEDDDAEHKLEDVVDGFILVGKADNKRDDYILDVKTVKVYGPSYKLDDWARQGNVYIWQRRKRGEAISRLLVDAWYRDWAESNISWKNYPKVGYEEFSLPVWTFEQQEEYIKDQIHFHTMMSHTECSDQQKGIRWEVYKNKNKTNSKVEHSKEAAEKWAAKQDTKDTYRVEKSKPIFCIRYCKSRSVCQYKKGNNDES